MHITIYDLLDHEGLALLVLPTSPVEIDSYIAVVYAAKHGAELGAYLHADKSVRNEFVHKLAGQGQPWFPIATGPTAPLAIRNMEQRVKAGIAHMTTARYVSAVRLATPYALLKCNTPGWTMPPLFEVADCPSLPDFFRQ